MDVQKSYKIVFSTTATDLNDPGVYAITNEGYWLFNLKKAMKSPAIFDKRLTFNEQEYHVNDVIINM